MGAPAETRQYVTCELMHHYKGQPLRGSSSSVVAETAMVK